MLLLIGLLLYVMVYIAIIGGILFFSAGRTDLPFFWAYLVLYSIPALVATVAVYLHDPQQIKDMIKTRRRSGEKSQDKLTIPLFLITFLASWVISGLDVGRYHWSDTIPATVQVIGLIVFTIGFSLVAWSTIINQFYSPMVRVQAERGQQVITDGPYQFVRHPGYIGWLLFFIGSGLALGSWLAALPAILPAIAVIRRTHIEDRMLQHDLAGYPEYVQTVRYRLIPGVW